MIAHEFINDYIRNTIKPSTGILRKLEEHAEANHVPIVQPEVAALLSVLTGLVKPVRILEVGTAIGYSAIIMAQHLQADGRVDTIERYELMQTQARHNIEEAGLTKKINVIAGDAMEILPTLTGKYQLIFLDAAKGQYPEFFPFLDALLEEGGLLVSDNVLYKGMIANNELVVRRKKTIVTRMRNYLNMLCSLESYDTTLLPAGDGVAISRKKMKNEG